jgi:hypothetical protein
MLRSSFDGPAALALGELQALQRLLQRKVPGRIELRVHGA